MQSSIYKIYGQLLQGSNKQFVIPVYQRNYSWTDSQCQLLLDDIKRIYDGEYENHFLGSLIYKVEQGNSNLANIIDGQQRITTMFLLCKAIMDVTNEERYKTEMSEILINRFTKESNLVPVKSDNEVYESVLNNTLELITHKENRIYQNYKFFVHYFETNHFEISKYINALTKLEVVVMELHERDNPQVIFESINSTGLSLTNADLIRNYLLLGVDYEEQNQLYDLYWLKFEKILGRDNVNVFFEHFLNITTRTKKITSANLYQLFKDEYPLFRQSPRTVFEKINLYVEVYKYLINEQLTYELSDNTKTKILKRYISEAKHVATATSRMFLTEVLLEHNAGHISDDELLYSFKITINYTFRRAVCNYGTNSLQNTFRFLMAQVKNNLNTVSYVDALNHALVTTKSYTKAKFPDDTEFFEELSTRNLYGKFKFLNYLLLTLENHNNKAKIDSDDISIEHVMPQKITNEWIKMIGDNYKELHADFVHDLGNLTLTTVNSELSNHSFKEKMEILKEESHFKLNQYFSDLTRWDTNDIHQRSETLAKIAINIWEYPQLSKDTIQIIEESKYRTLTLYDLYTEYESVRFSEVTINNEYVAKIKTYRDLYRAFVSYVYKHNQEKFEDYIIDNSEFSKTTNGQERYLISRLEQNTFDSEYFELEDIYVCKHFSGSGIIAQINKMCDVFNIDTNEIVMKVYL